ncbi:hypothetical protein KUCAC02_023854 [Chaenocephalus aceratus]|uniref:Uncharacterized protein n=1 Tax=Chaenocephalus aceratus TaxID=36190 RepID=A0ACB9WGE7_CHAAC|nr:hypothetical protein KUCAC02_023854 [Chaenocephalus aceratus]
MHVACQSELVPTDLQPFVSQRSTDDWWLQLTAFNKHQCVGKPSNRGDQWISKINSAMNYDPRYGPSLAKLNFSILIPPTANLTVMSCEEKKGKSLETQAAHRPGSSSSRLFCSMLGTGPKPCEQLHPPPHLAALCHYYRAV